VDDQFGTHKVIDVLVSEKRDLATTRRFFTHALAYGLSPIEVTTDHAAAYPRVLDELVPGAWCLVPVMSPSNTETTRSKPITDG
jgi:transposase-like protein